MATINQQQDLYGRRMVRAVKPITADMCTIVFTADNAASTAKSEIIAGATNISISYQQQVMRRRTLGSAGGSPLAVIYPTQPMGTLTMSRLFARYHDADPALNTIESLFSFPGWDICKGTASITLKFNGDSAFTGCNEKYGGFKLSGATVTGYSLSAEAEGLTVLDNVNIEFLQMIVVPA